MGIPLFLAKNSQQWPMTASFFYSMEYTLHHIDFLKPDYMTI
nr:MAG TPA_asm: hypothetical protein [Caudoviricetes sp.]